MARLKGFAGDFYTLEFVRGEPTRAQLPSAVPLRGRATHDEDGWGGRFACALVRAPHAGRCALFGADRMAARAARVRGALCGAYAAHVSTWAERGLKSVLAAALLLSSCGSGGHRDMYVHARRCMFLVGLWDQNDVVARGRKSHAKVGIWSAMADNILCFRVFIFKFLIT